MDSDVNLPKEPINQLKTTHVRNRRRKNGILQYNIVYNFNSSEKGKWISLDDLQNTDPEIKSLIAQYDEAHPIRKYQVNHQKGKKVTEIVGLVSDNKEPRYVVKLEGSDSLEAIHSSYLYKYHKALLLDFFESKIEFNYSKTQIANVKSEIPQQTQSNVPTNVSASSSTAQFNLPIQQFTQINNNQNDQKQIEQKSVNPLNQSNASFQSLQQQQCYMQMMQQIQASQPQLINGQMTQFSQNQPIPQIQSIPPKQKKTQQKKKQKASQQTAQLFYPQNMPIQSPFPMQSSQNMMMGKMGQMINFQNMQQVPHQM